MFRTSPASTLGVLHPTLQTPLLFTPTPCPLGSFNEAALPPLLIQFKFNLNDEQAGGNFPGTSPHLKRWLQQALRFSWKGFFGAFSSFFVNTNGIDVFGILCLVNSNPCWWICGPVKTKAFFVWSCCASRSLTLTRPSSDCAQRARWSSRGWTEQPRNLVRSEPSKVHETTRRERLTLESVGLCPRLAAFFSKFASFSSAFLDVTRWTLCRRTRHFLLSNKPWMSCSFASAEQLSFLMI